MQTTRLTPQLWLASLYIAAIAFAAPVARGAAARDSDTDVPVSNWLEQVAPHRAD